MLAGVDAHAAERQKSHFQRPLRTIVLFAPGGGQDTTARLLASRLNEIVGQQVIVGIVPEAQASPRHAAQGRR